ncbi:MAG: DIM6/NTAB family protein [Rhodobacteraceae bacterium HLUCCA08]|nr:MAG: DIM6/NTAB family protein [Rhodobacteraceae bacterium HLUCCA08]
MTAAPRSFEVGQQTERDYRRALGRFGTGVTVVTAADADGPVGITANSFSSVSLDPPLVLWSMARSSRRYPRFAGARHMAIHVLGAAQESVAHDFARSVAAFDRVAWAPGIGGVPLIEGCLARFECEAYQTHEGGDHVIHVLRVLRASVAEGAPLMVFGGTYGGFVAG